VNFHPKGSSSSKKEPGLAQNTCDLSFIMDNHKLTTTANCFSRVTLIKTLCSQTTWLINLSTIVTQTVLKGQRPNCTVHFGWELPKYFLGAFFLPAEEKKFTWWLEDVSFSTFYNQRKICFPEKSENIRFSFRWAR
jgi:hypothetical protein